VQKSAAAPALDVWQAPPPQPQEVTKPGPRLVSDAQPASPSPAADAASVQPSLFGPMEVLRPATPTRPSARGARTRSKRGEGLQHRFDFVTAEGAHTLPTSVQAAVACNFEVAETPQRVIAAAIDGAVALAGFALFAGTTKIIGQSIPLTTEAMVFYGFTILVLTVFYRVLCCIGNADTLGTRWAGLRLVNFNGMRPGRDARLRRLLGGFVSTVALCIGHAWALADEERLTWHDYISGTFPTPRFRNF
jgi:uncharacterized RDD family membrane protein YckC